MLSQLLLSVSRIKQLQWLQRLQGSINPGNRRQSGFYRVIQPIGGNWPGLNRNSSFQRMTPKFLTFYSVYLNSL
jgi:hypothetical protein